MKLTPAEGAAETGEALEMEKPEYPYGICLYLDEQALAKLGIDLMDVGTKVSLSGMATVTGTSEREYQGGSHKTLDLQITDLGLEPGAEKSDGDDSSVGAGKMRAADVMYGAFGGA